MRTTQFIVILSGAICREGPVQLAGSADTAVKVPGSFGAKGRRLRMTSGMTCYPIPSHVTYEV